MQVVERTVAHDHLIDAFHSFDGLLDGSGDVSAGAEELRGLLVELDEVADVGFPNHDRVAGDSWVQCEDARTSRSSVMTSCTSRTLPPVWWSWHR